jgi:lipoprotein-anchoring transpeptidase ErfK/SrfK
VIRRLLLLVVFFAATAPVLGGGAAPPDLIANGVTLGGIAVGGMSPVQAQSAVEPIFAQPIRIVRGGKEWDLRPARFGGAISVANGVDRAMRAPGGARIQLVTHVNVAEVRKFVEALDKHVSYPAQNAQLIGLKNLVPQLGEGKPGLRVLRGLTEERIIRALESAQHRRIRLAAVSVAPQVTRAHFGPVIVIRPGVNEMRFYEGTTLVRTFSVATGQSIYPTPLGTWKIVTMQRDPWWYPPTYDAWAKGLKPVPPGPNNPLGTRWMGLSAPGVGIHGTDSPASIGYSVSHGCIRMQVPDAEWLFDHVHVGTPVVITSS